MKPEVGQRVKVKDDFFAPSYRGKEGVIESIIICWPYYDGSVSNGTMVRIVLDSGFSFSIHIYNLLVRKN
jgi:hypothetical protein